MPGTEGVETSSEMEEEKHSNGHHASAEDETLMSSDGEVTSPDQDYKIGRLTQENEKLSQEIVALREENENVARCVKKLEKQVRDDADKLDATIKEAEEKKVEVLGEIQAVRKEVGALRQEKAELSEEKVVLLRDKERLEAGLSSAAKNISELSKKVDDAESAAAAAKERVAVLEAQNTRLSDDYQRLKSLSNALEAEMNCLRASKEGLEERNQKLVQELKRSEKDITDSQNQVEALTSNVSRLVEQLGAACERQASLEAERRDLISTTQERDEKIATLQQSVYNMTCELESLTEEVQKQKDLKGVAQDQALQLTSRNQILEEKVKQFTSKNQKLEEEVKRALATVQKMQEITCQEQGQRKALEDHVSTIEREKKQAEEARASLVNELNQIRGAYNKLCVTSQADARSQKQKIENLESALGQVKEEGHSSEKKVWQLTAELRAARELLEDKSSASKYALPTAVISVGALAVAGVFTYLRSKQSQAV